MVDSDTTLRSVEITDADALFLVVDGHRSYLRAWLPWVDQTRSANDTRAFIEKSIENEKNGTGIAAIIERRGEVCGVVGLDSIDVKNRSSDIGYWLREDLQGLGLATRAVACLADYAFTELGLNRLGILAAPENRRSRAVADRLGFREEGILREAERHGDRSTDLVSYTLLRREHENRER
jgi:ribosomal-protein-serine acetyltransferase